jgi:hypothetical protein
MRQRNGKPVKKSLAAANAAIWPGGAWPLEEIKAFGNFDSCKLLPVGFNVDM